MVEIDRSSGGVIEIVDSMVDNNVIAPLMPTVTKVNVNGVGVVRVAWDEFTCVVGENSWTVSAGSVDLNDADVPLPTVYYVYFLGNPSNNYYPDVVVSNADPSFSANSNLLIAAIIQMRSVNGTSTIYQAKFPNWSGTEELVHNVVDDMIYTSPQWIDGIAPKLTNATGTLDTSEGYIRFKSNATIHHDEVTTGKILCDDFTFHDTLMSILTYIDGTTIGANKWVKLVVARNIDQAGILDAPFYVVRQSKPNTEYTTEQEAYNDAEGKSADGFGIYGPSVVAIAYVTAQMNSSKTALDCTDGKLYDIRSYDGFGGGSSGGGSGTNDHHMLLNLTAYDDHTQYLKTNGTRQLTGDWDIGNHDIYSTGSIYGQIVSGDVIISTTDERSPMSVSSNIKVNNLNADQLDGYHASDFATSGTGVTNGDLHDHYGGDGAQIDHTHLSNLGLDDHTQYYNSTRHDTVIAHALGTVVPHDSHGSLTGLEADDHTQYLKADGTRSLSGDWTSNTKKIGTTDTITGSVLVSNASAGTAPLTVTSTTAVSNLNADMLDGYHASDIIGGGSGPYLKQDGTTPLTNNWTTGAYDIINTAKISANQLEANSGSTVLSGNEYSLLKTGTVSASGIGGGLVGLEIGALTNTATGSSSTEGIRVNGWTAASGSDSYGIRFPSAISGNYNTWGISFEDGFSATGGNLGVFYIAPITNSSSYFNNNATCFQIYSISNTGGGLAQAFLMNGSISSKASGAYFLRMNSNNIYSTTGGSAMGIQFNNIYTGDASVARSAFGFSTGNIYATLGTAYGLNFGGVYATNGTAAAINVTTVHTDTAGGYAYGIKADNVSAANASTVAGIKFGTISMVGSSGLHKSYGVQFDSLTNTGTFGYIYGTNIDQIACTGTGGYAIGHRVAASSPAGTSWYGMQAIVTTPSCEVYGYVSSISTPTNVAYAYSGSINGSSGATARVLDFNIESSTKEAIGAAIRINSPTGTGPAVGTDIGIYNANNVTATGHKITITGYGSAGTFGTDLNLNHSSGSGQLVGNNITSLTNNSTTATPSAGYRLTASVNKSDYPMNGFDITSMTNTTSVGPLHGFNIDSIAGSGTNTPRVCGLNIESLTGNGKVLGIRAMNIATSSSSVDDFAIGSYALVRSTGVAPAYGNVVTLTNTASAGFNSAGYVFYGTNASTLGMAAFTVYDFSSSTGVIAGFQVYDMYQTGNEHTYGTYMKSIHSDGTGHVYGYYIEDIYNTDVGTVAGSYFNNVENGGDGPAYGNYANVTAVGYTNNAYGAKYNVTIGASSGGMACGSSVSVNTTTTEGKLYGYRVETFTTTGGVLIKDDAGVRIEPLYGYCNTPGTTLNGIDIQEIQGAYGATQTTANGIRMGSIDHQDTAGGDANGIYMNYVNTVGGIARGINIHNILATNSPGGAQAYYVDQMSSPGNVAINDLSGFAANVISGGPLSIVRGFRYEYISTSAPSTFNVCGFYGGVTSAPNGADVNGIKFNIISSGNGAAEGMHIESIYSSGSGAVYGIHIPSMGIIGSATGSIYGLAIDTLTGNSTATSYGIRINTMANALASYGIYSGSITAVRSAYGAMFNNIAADSGYDSCVIWSGTTSSHGGSSYGIYNDVIRTTSGNNTAAGHVIGSILSNGGPAYGFYVASIVQGAGSEGAGLYVGTVTGNTSGTSYGVHVNAMTGGAQTGIKVGTLTSTSYVSHGADLGSITTTTGEANGLRIRAMASSSGAQYGIRQDSMTASGNATIYGRYLESASSSHSVYGTYIGTLTSSTYPVYGYYVDSVNATSTGESCGIGVNTVSGGGLTRGIVIENVVGNGTTTYGMYESSVRGTGLYVTGLGMYTISGTGTNTEVIGIYSHSIVSSSYTCAGIKFDDVRSNGHDASGIYLPSVNNSSATGYAVYGIRMTDIISNSTGTAYGMVVSNVSGNNACGLNVVTATGNATGSAYGVKIGTITGSVTTRGIEIVGPVSSTVNSASVNGIRIGNVLATGSTAAATGVLVSKATGTDNTNGIYVGTVNGTGAFNTGLNVASVNGASDSNCGVYVNTVTGATGTNYGVSVSTVSSASGIPGAGYHVLSVTGASGTGAQYGMYIGTVTGYNGDSCGLHVNSITGSAGTGGQACGLDIVSIVSNATGTAYGLKIGTVSGGANNYAIYADTGRVVLKGIGSSGVATQMRYDIATGGVYYQTSTRRAKENVVYEVESAWIYDLSPCTYDRKDGSSHNEIGLIAEDVKESVPVDVERNMVCYDPDGQTAAYDKEYLIVPMLAELQKLKAKIAELEQRLAE